MGIGFLLTPPWLCILCLAWHFHTCHSISSVRKSLPTNMVASPSSTYGHVVPRGGGKESVATKDATEMEGSPLAGDDERYSRQVYTLGARAHGLVRTSTIYIDGPPSSGLVYECAKNLALSGVGSVVIWKSDDRRDQIYHDETLDDLGKAYCRAAAKELKLQDAGSTTQESESVLGRYIRCLNPTVRVSYSQRLECSDQEGRSSQGVILCIDRPYETQVRLNWVARQRNLAFVAVETAGVYGRVFCDFGSSFDVYDLDGETPVVVPLDKVEVALRQEESSQTNPGELLVRAIETEKHDVSSGDRIQFQLSDGTMMPEQFTVIKVLSPQLVSVKLDSCKNTEELENVKDVINEKAASFCRVKSPTRLSFMSLPDAIEKAKGHTLSDLFTPCDFDKSLDDKRLKSVLSCFQALSVFVETRQSLPTSTDLHVFQQLTRESLGEFSAQRKHVRNFLRSCAGKLTPLQAMFGALGAQEVMKAVTGLYNPVRQILLYDCDELVSEADDERDAPSSRSKVDSGLSYILGTNLKEKVMSTRLFVVGAGAIGCEHLKNLAAMGFCTGKNGCISLTDMDTIEKSNLSRQLLFREENIGDFKSVAARDAILRFNPAVKINAHTSKVGHESHGPFGENFWTSNADIVLNALDNMEARLFMDQQCVAYQKALVDAGTLGPKGNVQVVVPHQSESYGSSVDPPESDIPVCTLKNFPYAISHTIQWGRDLFDGLFNRRPKQANDFAAMCLASDSTRELAQTLIRDLGEAAAVEAADELAEDLSFASESSTSGESHSSARRDATRWAVRLATRLFHDAIDDLLREHPVDSLDEDGEPFWSGTRKVPSPILFARSPDADDMSTLSANQNLLEFVQAAARLRLEILFGKNDGCRLTDAEAREALLDACDEGSVSRQDSTERRTSIEAMIMAKLQPVTSGAKSNLLTVEFEKDDNENGHVQFVTAASNLRAMCYGIPPVDSMETRRVAGKIIPAMITTTAVVSALSCIELLKLLQGASLNKYRNAFINLALPFFAFSMPLPAEEVPGPHGKMFTVWDSIAIREKKGSIHGRGLTLKRFIKYLKKAISDDPDGLEVTTVSAGDFLIYADFLHGHDESLLRRSIWELLASGAQSEANDIQIQPAFDNEVELRVTLEDRISGQDYELPLIRLHRTESEA